MDVHRKTCHVLPLSQPTPFRHCHRHRRGNRPRSQRSRASPSPVPFLVLPCHCQCQHRSSECLSEGRCVSTLAPSCPCETVPSQHGAPTPSSCLCLLLASAAVVCLGSIPDPRNPSIHPSTHLIMLPGRAGLAAPLSRDCSCVSPIASVMSLSLLLPPPPPLLLSFLGPRDHRVQARQQLRSVCPRI